jgi:hypothetical protein
MMPAWYTRFSKSMDSRYFFMLKSGVLIVRILFDLKKLLLKIKFTFEKIEFVQLFIIAFVFC